MTEGMRFTTPRHREVYVAYGTVYDCVDALAAILFIIGLPLQLSAPPSFGVYPVDLR